MHRHAGPGCVTLRSEYATGSCPSSGPGWLSASSAEPVLKNWERHTVQPVQRIVWFITVDRAFFLMAIRPPSTDPPQVVSAC
jgi:hypothetical protein